MAEIVNLRQVRKARARAAAKAEAAANAALHGRTKGRKAAERAAAEAAARHLDGHRIVAQGSADAAGAAAADPRHPTPQEPGRD
jgi:phage protein D